jgi:hypothetical protein
MNIPGGEGRQQIPPPGGFGPLRLGRLQFPGRAGEIARYLGFRKRYVSRIGDHRRTALAAQQHGVGTQRPLHPPASTGMLDHRPRPEAMLHGPRLDSRYEPPPTKDATDSAIIFATRVTYCAPAKAKFSTSGSAKGKASLQSPRINPLISLSRRCNRQSKTTPGARRIIVPE